MGVQDSLNAFARTWVADRNVAERTVSQVVAATDPAPSEVARREIIAQVFDLMRRIERGSNLRQIYESVTGLVDSRNDAIARRAYSAVVGALVSHLLHKELDGTATAEELILKRRIWQESRERLRF